MKINKIGISALGSKVNLVSFFLLTCFVFFSGCSQAPSVRPTDKYYTVDYSPSGKSGELQIPVTYTLWVPGEAKTIRGVILHRHGAGILASEQGAAAATDLHWQALAKKWDCALLGSSYHVLNDATDLTPGGSELWFDPRLGSDQVFKNALDKFAKQTNHPEIAKVPWVLWGHSGGGIWSDVMACLHPERVVLYGYGLVLQPHFSKDRNLSNLKFLKKYTRFLSWVMQVSKNKERGCLGWHFSHSGLVPVSRV